MSKKLYAVCIEEEQFNKVIDFFRKTYEKEYRKHNKYVNGEGKELKKMKYDTLNNKPLAKRTNKDNAFIKRYDEAIAFIQTQYVVPFEYQEIKQQEAEEI